MDVAEEHGESGSVCKSPQVPLGYVLRLSELARPFFHLFKLRVRHCPCALFRFSRNFHSSSPGQSNLKPLDTMGSNYITLLFLWSSRQLPPFLNCLFSSSNALRRRLVFRHSATCHYTLYSFHHGRFRFFQVNRPRHPLIYTSGREYCATACSLLPTSLSDSGSL